MKQCRKIIEDALTVREVVGAENPLPPEPPVPAGPPDPSERTRMPDWLNAGRLDLTDK